MWTVSRHSTRSSVAIQAEFDICVKSNRRHQTSPRSCAALESQFVHTPHSLIRAAPGESVTTSRRSTCVVFLVGYGQARRRPQNPK